MRPRQRVTFQRPVRVSDGQGGGTSSPTIIAASLPCAFEQLKEYERLAAQQLTSTAFYRLRFRARTDLRVTDQAVVTFADTGLSQTLQVEAFARADERGREMYAYCSAVQA